MNKKISQSITQFQGGILQGLTLRVKLILRLMADRRVSFWPKLIPVAAVIYWISPIDLIMLIPGLSAVDDMAVLWFAQYIFIELCPADVVQEIVDSLVINHTIVDAGEVLNQAAGPEKMQVLPGSRS
jgi:uncharacterized membrane protein YkvA (DUF1232 family)